MKASSESGLWAMRIGIGSGVMARGGYQRARAWLSIPALALALAAAACAPPSPAPPGAPPAATEPDPTAPPATAPGLDRPAPPPAAPEADAERRAGSLTVEGRLTDEGVECPAMRGRDSKLYTLLGSLGDFGPGDEVVVTAEPVEISFCMQGTTIKVLEIAAAPG